MIGPDDAVLHGQEAVQLLERQAQQGEEDLGGERHGELLGEVHLAPVDETVDQVVHEGRDLVVHRLHLARSEDRVEQLAELLVLRRVDLQGDHRPLVAQVDRVHVGREGLGVAQGLHDVRLAREQDPVPRRQVVDGHDGHLVAQRLPDRLRVGGHLRTHGAHRIASPVGVAAGALGALGGFDGFGFQSLSHVVTPI